jgi:hypothetical protein
MDANVEIPLRAVNPVANAHRSRAVSTPIVTSDKPKTGLNAPDLMLENMIRPNQDRNEKLQANEESKIKDSEGGNNE